MTCLLDAGQMLLEKVMPDEDCEITVEMLFIEISVV